MANYCYKVMFGTLVLGLIAFLIVNVRQHVLAQGQLKLVRTLTGPVRGERRLGDVLDQARPYYAFRGIPYAERPIGPLRFKPALPVRPWKAVRSCYDHAPVCMQLNAKQEAIGDEDCLYLNVYTPDVDPPSDQLRAVLVWLPGVADWHTGSGNVDTLGPEFLMEQDVLLVTLNARLGVLGYLNLDTGDVPGNQGLGDQQLALEWIYENVRLFGGDRERITLGGSGTGAVAVQLHMYAERSAALFRRSVQMSTAFGQWSTFERPPAGILRAELLALVRRPNTRRVNNADLVNELQACKAKALVEAFGQRSHAWLGPSTETATVEYPFLGTTAAAALDWRLETATANWTTAKDVLTGYTSAEAIAIASAAAFEQFRAANGTAALPWRVPFRRQATATALWSQIAGRYFAGVNATRTEYVRLLGDLYQKYLVDRRVLFVAARSSGHVYRYRFDLDTQLNLEKRWSGGAAQREFSGSLAGAAHGDDLCYVFRCEAVKGMYSNVTQTTPAYRQIVAMSRAYAQFVKTGDPGVPDWRPIVDRQNSTANVTVSERFMDITSNGWVAGGDEFAAERAFWNELIEG